jgi:MFS family permease
MTDNQDTPRIRSTFLRWLLRLDQPVPKRSQDEIAAEVKRNYRWNFWVNLLDGTAFWLGIGFASTSTIMPLFLSKLTDSPLPVGLLAVVTQGGWFLPQLFTANAVEQLARKKPIVVNLGFFLERLPFWIAALSPLLAFRSPTLAMVVFLLAITWHVVGGGVVATAWQDLIARTFPLERRGRFFGLTSAVGAVVAALSARFSRYLLERYPFPTEFLYIFLLAAGGITLSWVFLSLTREPIQPASAPRRSNRDFLRKLPTILHKDHNFRNYLIARVLLALGTMGNGFLTVAALRRWQIADGVVSDYTLILLVGQALSNLIFGFLADKGGHLRNLVLGTLSAGVSFVIAWIAVDPRWYYMVFFLQGVAFGAVYVSGIMVVVEFCTPERRPTYVGLANTSSGIAGMSAPLLGTALASLNYSVLFAVSAAFSILALIAIKWVVREPRWAKKVGSGDPTTLM